MWKSYGTSSNHWKHRFIIDIGLILLQVHWIITKNNWRLEAFDQTKVGRMWKS
jgi:hypothetical protein